MLDQQPTEIAWPAPGRWSLQRASVTGLRSRCLRLRTWASSRLRIPATESFVTHHEEFADPIAVPGANMRSLFTDTEEVDDATVEQVDDDAWFCPTCRRTRRAATGLCPDDGTALVELPPPIEP